MDIVQVKAKWDSFAQYYFKVEETPQSFYYPLARVGGLPQAKNVLEIGCGGMLHSHQLLDMISTDCRYIATDLSSSMVQHSLTRLSALHPDEKRVIVQEANGQDLSSFQAGVFDLVVANNVLIHTADPERMLAQVRRVLRPGGRFALTTWGRPQRCKYFSVLSQTLQKLNLGTAVKRRSPFLWNTEAKLTTFLQSNGYNVDKVWTQFTPYYFTDQTGADDYLNANDTVGMLAQYDQAQRHSIRQVYKQLFMEVINSGQPFGFQAVLAVAQRV